MRTIQVSDDTYKFLKECKQELLSQDNRGTSNPIFGFKEECLHYAEEYNDGVAFVDTNSSEIITTREKPNYIESIVDHLLYYYDNKEDKIITILIDNGQDVGELTRQLDKFDATLPNTKEDRRKLLKKLLLHTFTDIIVSTRMHNDIFDELHIKTTGYKREHRQYSEVVSLFSSDLVAHEQSNKHNMPESYYSYVFHNNKAPKIEKLREVLTSGIHFDTDIVVEASAYQNT